MTESLKKLKILSVGHVTESYGPMQALPKYLTKKKADFAVIAHPFKISAIPASTFTVYSKGKELKKLSGISYKTWEPLHFLIDTLTTFYFVFRAGQKWDLYIGSDSLNVFSGLILRTIGVVKKVVFYEYDYTPHRFSNKLLNGIFHWFNRVAARNADVVWDNPPNLMVIRKKQGADREKVFRVPHGVDLDQVKIPPFNKIKRYTLVYTGHVTISKGLQLLIDSLPDVIKKIPQVKVAIVGSGPYEAEYKKLVKKNKLFKYFKFFGYTQHDWTLAYLPGCAAALAPYIPEEGGTFQYAEPLKIKDYLGCGLPVIVTRVPAFHREIEKKKLGIAINYEAKELTKAIIKLLKNERFLKTCRQNAQRYAANITWDYTYDKAFQKTLRLVKI